jgi:hypothetical protein
MSAHQPGPEYDRPGTFAPLQMFRQTAPHGTEGLDLERKSHPFERSFSTRQQ